MNSGRLRSATLILALWGIALTPPAGAEHRDGEPFTDMSLQELLQLEVFEAASLIPTESSKAPGTVYSFGRAEIRRLGVRRIDDLLRFVPGFQLNQYRKRHQSIWARGMINRYNDKVTLLVDGVPVRDLYYGHFSLGESLPLEIVDKVEIIVGPASSIYGANAFAAIISVTTRGFEDHLAVEATFEVGDNDRFKETVRLSSEHFQLFVSRLDQEAPFFSDRKSFIGDDSLQELDEEFSFLRLQARPIPELTLYLEYQKTETPFVFIPSTQDAYVEHEPLSAGLIYERGDLSDGLVEFKLYYRNEDNTEYEIEQETRRPAYREYQHASRAGADVAYFRSLGEQHTAAIGAFWSHERAEDFDFTRWYHFRDGFLDPPITGTLLAEPEIRNDDYALFVQDVWKFHPEWTLTLGARADFYDAFDEQFNYRAALVFSPTESRVFKLLYGTAIRTPTFREYLKVLEGTSFVAPVPEPERIQSAEFGFHQHWRQAKASLTVFHNRFEDYIHEVPTPDGEDEYFANSDRPFRVAGIEALVQVRPHPDLDLRLSGAYLDAEESGVGDVPYLAETTASLTVDYSYLDHHGVGMAFVYNGSRTDTNEAPEDDPDAFTLIGLHGRGHIFGSLEYAFGVDNLLDERIFDPAADFGTRYNSEQTGREVWASLRWTWHR